MSIRPTPGQWTIPACNLTAEKPKFCYPGGGGPHRPLAAGGKIYPLLTSPAAGEGLSAGRVAMDVQPKSRRAIGSSPRMGEAGWGSVGRAGRGGGLGAIGAGGECLVPIAPRGHGAVGALRPGAVGEWGTRSSTFSEKSNFFFFLCPGDVGPHRPLAADGKVGCLWFGEDLPHPSPPLAAALRGGG